MRHTPTVIGDTVACSRRFQPAPTNKQTPPQAGTLLRAPGWHAGAKCVAPSRVWLEPRHATYTRSDIARMSRWIPTTLLLVLARFSRMPPLAELDDRSQGVGIP
jgi:hypothetical protein